MSFPLIFPAGICAALGVSSVVGFWSASSLFDVQCWVLLQHQGGGGGPMMNGMYAMQNGMVQRPAAVEEPPAKRFKPGQAQAVMQGNHGTSLIEAMNALEIRSHLDTLQVPPLPGLCCLTHAVGEQGNASSSTPHKEGSGHLHTASAEQGAEFYTLHLHNAFSILIHRSSCAGVGVT